MQKAPNTACTRTAGFTPLNWHFSCFRLCPFLGPSVVGTILESSGYNTFTMGRNLAYASDCSLPIVDGGDGLTTTGCGVLELDGAATGTFSSTLEAHNWQFSIKNNKHFAILIQDDDESCTNNMVLDSNGRVIQDWGTTNICIPGTTSYKPYPNLINLPANSTYIIRLKAEKIPGTYWLKIEEQE